VPACLLDTQNNSVDPQESVKCLLQLPEAALDLLLKKLDPCSLANTAATCSSLSRAAPATVSKVAACCRTIKAFESLLAWLQKHSSSLNNLTECSIINACAD
jgi:predicted transcriptional regulator